MEPPSPYGESRLPRDSVSQATVAGNLEAGKTVSLAAHVPYPSGMNASCAVLISGYSFGTEWESVAFYPYRGDGGVDVYAVRPTAGVGQSVVLDVVFVDA